MSVCGDAHSERKIATGNMEATGAPVRHPSHAAEATKGNVLVSVKRPIVAELASGKSKNQKARGDCLFQPASPPYARFACRESTNAQDASGRMVQLMAAKIAPVTAAPTQQPA